MKLQQVQTAWGYHEGPGTLLRWTAKRKSSDILTGSEDLPWCSSWEFLFSWPLLTDLAQQTDPSVSLGDSLDAVASEAHFSLLSGQHMSRRINTHTQCQLRGFPGNSWFHQALLNFSDAAVVTRQLPNPSQPAGSLSAQKKPNSWDKITSWWHSALFDSLRLIPWVDSYT